MEPGKGKICQNISETELSLAMMVSGTKQKNMSLLPLCMRNPQATAI